MGEDARVTAVGVIGEALIDILPAAGDAVVARPGGGPANVAVALARLGLDTRFLGRTSSDRWGQRLRAHLTAEGVRLDGTVGPEPTAIAFADLDEHGAASYRFLWEATADRQLTATELTLAIDGLDGVHVGSCACVLEPAATAIAETIVAIEESLVVSFDPNVRPAVIEDPAAARDRLLLIADHAHVIRASQEDLAWLCPDEDVEQAAWGLLDGTQTHLVVVTRGADGAEVFTPRFQLPVPASQAGPVIDTVGAGDTFAAGLLAGLAARDLLTVAAIKRLDVATAREVAAFAAAAAGVTVTRAGADPPRRDDVPS